jgi:hypothetical protein
MPPWEIYVWPWDTRFTNEYYDQRVFTILEQDVRPVCHTGHMRKTVAVALLVLVLAGCRAPQPVPAVTAPVTVIPAAQPTSTPSLRVTITGWQEPCALADGSTLDWVVDVLDTSDPSSVVTVDVGEGNVPGSDWRVVAFLSSPQYNSVFISSFFTDGHTWIDIGYVMFYDGQVGDFYPRWESVEWDGDRLLAAQHAQQQAIACVAASR